MKLLCWLALILVTWSGVWASADPALADEQLPFESREAQALKDAVERGDMEALLQQARRLTQTKPDLLEGWFVYGAVHAQSGEYEAALSALRRGLKGKESDLPFLLMIARIHGDRAKLGSGARYVPGGVQYSPAAVGEDDGAFRRDENRAAAEALAQALQIRPDRWTYQEEHLAYLLAAGAATEARNAARGYVARNADIPKLWLRLAQAEAELGAWPEAKAGAERSIELRPGQADAYSVLRRAAEATADVEVAASLRKREQFYGFTHEAFPVPYTDARYDTLAPLLTPRGARDVPGEPEPSAAEVEARHLRAEAVVRQLLEEKSPESTAILATLCWRHEWHGEIERSIFDELESRQAEAALLTLFVEASSFCTAGGAAPALARLKSRAALPLIIERLPMDKNMFPMNLPEALAIYGDPSAVPPLAKALREALRENTKAIGRDFNLGLALGGGMFVSRCLWALAGFDTPEAVQALEEAAKSKRYRAEALGALFTRTRNPKHWAALQKELKRDPSEADSLADTYASLGMPEASVLRKIADSAAKKKK